MSRTCQMLGTGRLVGNNVSKSNRKTKRTFLPNLIEKSFYSEILKKTFSIKITTRTNRTIAKHGSFDDFLINVKKTNMTDFAKQLKAKIFKISPKSLEEQIQISKQKHASKIAKIKKA